MGKAFLIVSSIQQVMADPAKAAAMGQSLGLDLSKLPAGTDMFALLARLPAAQLAQVTTAINQKFSGTGRQPDQSRSAVGAVKAEYAALGMDTGKIQTSLHPAHRHPHAAVIAARRRCTVAVGFLASKTAAGSARDMRKDLFERVESFSNTEFDKFSTASLITRSTNDITQIQMVVFMMMRMVFYAPIIGVGGVILALGKSTSMWWIIALAVLVLIGLIVIVFSISLPKFKIMQSLIDRLNLVTRENLSGMMVIRAFNKQEFEEDRFDKANRGSDRAPACSSTASW